jgi:hypothetical protein
MVAGDMERRIVAAAGHQRSRWPQQEQGDGGSEWDSTAKEWHGPMGSYINRVTT